MEQPIRVLYIVGGRLNYGGIETFIMNYYRNLDKSKVQIDFIVNGYEKGVFDEEIKSMGGKIYNVPQRGKHFFRHKKEIKKIIKARKYKIVHAHANHLNGLFLSIAKQCDVPIRISHSHTANVINVNKIKKFIFEYYKSKVIKCATDYWACSKLAGEWLYGKENIENNKVTIIKNAIDLDKYKYNITARKKVRTQLGIDDDFVIGHIGRFGFEKNHKFIIDLYQKYNKKHDSSKLILIGEGPLQGKIKDEIMEKKLQNNIIVIDRTKNIGEILNAFDVFILPSLYEGLPFVSIEAQVSGLPCILSEAVSKEVKISDNVNFIKLNIEDWISKIEEYTNKYKRGTNIESITKLGYNIKEEAKRLEKKYIELYNK